MTITLDQITGGEDVAVRFADTQLRSTDADGKRTVTGVGVPYGQVFETSFFRETFEAGAIEDDAAALAFFEHRSPIGRLTASRDTTEGREVTLTLSRTATADEAYTLAQDGVIRGLSVAFRPVEWREEHTDDDDRPLIVHTKVEVREYSLVAFPAYAAARIDHVRSAPTTKETPMTVTGADNALDLSNLVTRSELDAATSTITDRLEDVQRSLTPAAGTGPTEGLQTRAEQWKSLGDWVQSIADDKHARHDEAVTLYRDITTSDIPSKLVNTPGFIGDLTKRITERRRWLNRFRTRALPAKGMSVDYIQTRVTATVAEQSRQLDALAKGTGFTVTPASSPVRTFGGAETVARQVIDRSEAWALTGMFEAFAMQYARETENATRSHIIAALDAILAEDDAEKTVSVPTDFGAFDWIDAIVDSSGRFEDLGYSVQELAVSPDVFKRLAAEAGTDGRPLLTVSGTGVNVVGQMNLPAASGELMRVPVTVLHGSQGRALFYDPVAIETLESPGAPFWLQQDQVLNLSRDFACYGYVAHITPHPKALLPVAFGA
ncbi:MAG: HK97 family phage prohead protease [Micrococcus sp.]|nr:HK97 family phage prohead protease [Micrococcus sp.]